MLGRSNITHMYATNKNSVLVQKCFTLGVAVEDSAPNSNFSKLLELSETSGARKLIVGLPVNIERANSHRYDVARWMVCRPRPSKDPQSSHQCTVHFLRSQVQVQWVIYAVSGSLVIYE